MTGRILAIDPGTEASGWVELDTATLAVLGHGRVANEELVAIVGGSDVDEVAIETASGRRGQPFGVALIEAIRWAGRFEQAAAVPVARVSRDAVKARLLVRPNVRDADALVRQTLIDRYAAIAGDPLGGKPAAIGSKAAPGPLHGVKRDAWAALALAVARLDGAETIDQERERHAEAKAARRAARP